MWEAWGPGCLKCALPGFFATGRGKIEALQVERGMCGKCVGVNIILIYILQWRPRDGNQLNLEDVRRHCQE